MTKNQLSILRTVIPGLLMIFVAYSFSVTHFTLAAFVTAFDLKTWSGYVVLLVAGALYNISGIRNQFLKRYWQRIDNNINDSLIAFLTPEEIGDLRWQKIKEERQIMDVFYNLIDNDESLKARGGGIYFNGVFVTTAADVAIIFTAGSFLQAFETYRTSQIHHAEWTIFFIVVALLAWLIILPIVIRRHLGLSDAQLNFIATHFKSNTQTKLREILRNVPAPDKPAEPPDY